MPRLPLVRPGAFFAERVPLDLATAVGVVVAVAVVITAAVGLLGWLVAGHVTGTFTVDNPDRPPDWVCEGEDNGSVFADECDEPARLNVSASGLVLDAFTERLPIAFVSPLLAWVVFAGILHVLTGLLGGQNGIDQTLAVTAWGMIPSALRAVAVLVGAAVVLQGSTVPSDPQALLAQVDALRDLSRSAPMALIALGEAVWQGYIWTYGLAHAREMDIENAGLAAGVVVAVSFVLGLLG